MTVRFSVPEMHCEGCVSAIRQALSAAPGVTLLGVDLGGRTLEIEARTEEAAAGARAAVEAAGFDVAPETAVA